MCQFARQSNDLTSWHRTPQLSWMSFKSECPPAIVFEVVCIFQHLQTWVCGWLTCCPGSRSLGGCITSLKWVSSDAHLIALTFTWTAWRQNRMFTLWTNMYNTLTLSVKNMKCTDLPSFMHLYIRCWHICLFASVVCGGWKAACAP